MFKEHDAITLTSNVPLDRTWDIPEDSPLLTNGVPAKGLIPGDIGTIVCVQGDGEAYEVEFLEPDGYTVAIATVLPGEARPLAEGDIDCYRFWKEPAE